MQWGKLGAVRLDRRECRLVVFVVRAVAIDAGRRRRDRSMRSLEDRVVAVAAIHLQLSSMQCMAERNGLLRLVADV